MSVFEKQIPGRIGVHRYKQIIKGSKMPDLCYNRLIVNAATAVGQKQLKEFVQKSKSTSGVFSFDPTYPMPKELEIESSTMVNHGLEIIRWQKGEPNNLAQELESKWCKNSSITSVDELVNHLINRNHANLVLGQKAYDNLARFGYINWSDWSTSHWGVKWDAAECEIIRQDDSVFEVSFTTPWNAPVGWLKKISSDYPDLSFNLYYDAEMYESLIVHDNGRFYDLENIICSDRPIISDNICNYMPGARIKPHKNYGKEYLYRNITNDKSDKHPFTFIITDRDTVIVQFDDKIRLDQCYNVMSPEEYRNLLCENVVKTRDDKNLLMSINRDYSDCPALLYSMLIKCTTLHEAIDKCVKFRAELHKPIEDIIQKRILEKKLNTEENNQIK